MIRSCKHEFTQFSIHVASFKPSLHFYKFMTCLIGNVLYFGDCPLWLCASLLPFPLSRIDFSWSTFCPVCMLMHNMKDKMVLNFGEHLLLQGLSPNQFSKCVCPNNSLMPILRERLNQCQWIHDHFTHIQNHSVRPKTMKDKEMTIMIGSNNVE